MVFKTLDINKLRTVIPKRQEENKGSLIIAHFASLREILHCSSRKRNLESNWDILS